MSIPMIDVIKYIIKILDHDGDYDGYIGVNMGITCPKPHFTATYIGGRKVIYKYLGPPERITSLDYYVIDDQEAFFDRVRASCFPGFNDFKAVDF
jgi:hypothetical protein